MSSMEIVNDMGIGWNMANSFDCYDDVIEIKTPDDQIKLWGNPIPSKELFSNIKKYGIKTVRLPITWKFFIDEVGNVDPVWMSRVKEVVNLITKKNLYCIINIHYDGIIGYWLNEGIKVKDKFLNLWSQIANEFKNYDQYLIFESMNDIEYKDDNNFEYLNFL
jgi:endoglucanase